MRQKVLVDQALIDWICLFAVCDMKRGFDRHLLLDKLHKHGLIDFCEGEYHVKERKKEVFSNKNKLFKKKLY